MSAVKIAGPSSVVGALSVFDPDAEMPAGYEVTGHRYPILTKALEPGAKIKGEPGSMLIMGDHVKMKTKFQGVGALFGGELLKNIYENAGQTPSHVSLAGNVPFGSLVPVSVVEGQPFVCKRGLYFAGDESVKVTAGILRARSGAACCCGGMPPIVQKLKGSGQAFLLGSGTVVKKELIAGEELLVSTEAILGFQENMSFDVRQVGNFITCCCGGEGCFNTVLRGPGTVYLQSFGIEKLTKLMITAGGGGDGGGGAAGGGAPVDVQEMER